MIEHDTNEICFGKTSPADLNALMSGSKVCFGYLGNPSNSYKTSIKQSLSLEDLRNHPKTKKEIKGKRMSDSSETSCHHS